MGNIFVRYDYDYNNFYTGLITYINHQRYIGQFKYRFFTHSDLIYGGNEISVGSMNCNLLHKLCPVTDVTSDPLMKDLNVGDIYIFGSLPSFSANKLKADTALYNVSKKMWVKKEQNAGLVPFIEYMGQIILESKEYKPSGLWALSNAINQVEFMKGKTA